MFEDTTRMKKVKKYRSWKPLSATDLISLMYPCLFIYWILGFFPYKLEDSRFVLSKTRFTFTAFMMILYVISLLMVIYATNFETVINNAQLITYANLCIFLDGIVIVGMYMYTGKRLIVLQSLSDVTSFLTPRDFDKLARFIHAKDIFGFFYLIAHLPNCFKGNMYLTLQNFSRLYVILANFYTDMFYMNCVLTLKLCFKRIDVCLLKLKILPRCDDLRMQKSVYHRQKNPLLLMKLKEFEEKHLDISDVVELLNNTFIVRIVTMTVSTFTVVTFNLYFHILFTNSPDHYDMYFWYWQYISPACFYMMNFSLIIWACETATRQAQKIKTTLYDVFSDTTDPATKREVQLFSLQVLHRNNIFSAKAIDVNAGLLLRIIGGIFMYIMILFQLLLGSNACKKTT
ncbi:hypothetical protein ANTRET_LOCUS5085 [Anthophora retusa]